MSRTIPISSADFAVEVDPDGVAHVILGHAGRMPAFSTAGHAEIGAIWPTLAQAADVRSILIRSVGKGFCAGSTWELTAEMVQEHDTRLRVMHEARALVQGMLDCDKPIVSAINGAAVGAGTALALLADVSVAAREAKIFDGHTRIGVAAGDHATLIWPLLCGLAKAKLYLLLGDPLSGEEAERIGLVSLCVEGSALESTATDIARRLASSSPEAVQFTKRSLNHWLRAAWPGFEHGLALEMLAFGGREARERLAAVRERRPPRF